MQMSELARGKEGRESKLFPGRSESSDRYFSKSNGMRDVLQKREREGKAVGGQKNQNLSES